MKDINYVAKNSKNDGAISEKSDLSELSN